MTQANEMRKNTMDKVNDAAQTASKSVNETFESVKNRTEEVMKQAGDKAHEASEKVQKWANETFDTTSESMKGFGKEVTDVVRKYPVPAILVGFGIGLLLGRGFRS